MSYLSSISIAVPEYIHNQESLISFYGNATNDANSQRKINAVAKKSGIEKRYSVLPDFSLEPESYTFFASTLQDPEPTMSQRMTLYKQHALNLALQSIRSMPNYHGIKNSITHIITVTCTGLFAPGLDIEIIEALDLPKTTQRSSINFMGCNAAIIALNQANSICKAYGNAQVLVVSVELCSIHFQRNFSDDYILSNSLFGDGSAACIVSSQPLINSKSIGIKSFHSAIIHNGFGDMAWYLSEQGFLMNLSTYVSQLINSEIKNLLVSAGIDLQSIKHWAVHPGGKKILDELSVALLLPKENFIDSYNTLREYGNMSSATILFVLHSLLSTNTISQNEPLLAVAFGPGLSVETMMLEYV